MVYYLILAIILSCSQAFAAYSPLNVKEADGSPSVHDVRRITVTNGTLTDNGSGVVTITTGGGGGGGTPGGSDTQVQFNDGGAFGGDSGFTFTKASDLLTIGADGTDGSLKIYSEQGGTDYSVTLNPNASMTQNVTYALPADDGSSDQFLKTDGSGNLTWATPASTSGGWTDDGTVVRLTTSTDDVGIGTASPSQQLEITENFEMPPTTTTVGIVYMGADPIFHSYGVSLDGTDLNLFIGQRAGNFTNEGHNNIIIGADAGIAITDTIQSIVIGNGAFESATDAPQSVAIGTDSLRDVTTGQENVSIGHQAGMSLTTGGNNSCLGNQCLQYGGDALRNACVGQGCLQLTTGDNNVALGNRAGDVNTTGSNNVFLGKDAGHTSTATLTNAVAIGYNAQVTASNKMVLGNGITDYEFRGVSYNFPSSQGSADTYLKNDGSGNLSWASSLTTSGTITSSATGSLGWSVVTAANQACTTTCTSAAMGGQDTDSAPYPIVGPSDATADRCFCAGAS